MTDETSFRDFGVLPANLAPPAGAVRAYYSTGRVIGQYAGTAIVSALGLGLATLFVLFVTPLLSVLAVAAALLGFGAVVFLATHNDYRWVESTDDGVLRAKHLYTGRVIERRVEEIAALRTMVYPVRRLATVVIESLLGRVKGIEIRFRDGRTPLRVMRADPAMTNARELIEAVVYRMSRHRGVDAEVIGLDGQPLVRSIHWAGEAPPGREGNAGRVLAACGLMLAMIFGAILAFMGSFEQRRREIALSPAPEVSLRALIERGPGANRHVTVTGFVPGGYTFEQRGKSQAWSSVWVALYPADGSRRPRGEIRAVLTSSDVPDEDALRRMLAGGRVTGVCTESPRSSWGTELGPQIVAANQGAALKAAWLIEELREPPSESRVQTTLIGAAGCFAAVIAVAGGLYWAAARARRPSAAVRI